MYFMNKIIVQHVDLIPHSPRSHVHLGTWPIPHLTLQPLHLSTKEEEEEEQEQEQEEKQQQQEQEHKNTRK